MAVNFTGISRKSFLLTYKRLFRFIPLNRLLQMLEQDTMAFVYPGLWEDPYEKLILNSSFSIDNQPFDLPVKDNIFCLCWSGTQNSEAFWKGYTPLNDGICIQLDTEKMLDVLNALTGFDVYIGKVNYVRTQDILSSKMRNNRTYIQSLNTPDVGIPHIKLLLQKRLAFRYENEVRILLVPKTRMTEKIYHLPLNLREVLTEFLIHPRCGDYFTEMIKDYFKDKYNLTVKKSRLYEEAYYKIKV
jgi:Protein of unknown function (DUF2971)